MAKTITKSAVLKAAKGQGLKRDFAIPPRDAMTFTYFGPKATDNYVVLFRDQKTGQQIRGFHEYAETMTQANEKGERKVRYWRGQGARVDYLVKPIRKDAGKAQGLKASPVVSRLTTLISKAQALYPEMEQGTTNGHIVRASQLYRALFPLREQIEGKKKVLVWRYLDEAIAHLENVTYKHEQLIAAGLRPSDEIRVVAARLTSAVRVLKSQ